MILECADWPRLDGAANSREGDSRITKPQDLMTRQIHLGLFMQGTGNHVAGWRMPGAYTNYQSMEVCLGLARIAERGKFDMLFSGDGYGVQRGQQPSRRIALSAHSDVLRHRHGDDACRPRGHRLDDLQRSLHGGARLRDARFHLERARRLERRHDGAIGRRCGFSAASIPITRSATRRRPNSFGS